MAGVEPGWRVPSYCMKMVFTCKNIGEFAPTQDKTFADLRTFKQKSFGIVRKPSF